MSYTKTAIYPPNPNTTRGQATKLDAHKSKIAYANGKSVIIRDLSDSALNVTYNGHVQPTTVARFAPTGFYVASGDAAGTVRVWDTVGEDQTLKGEYKVISGRINDVAWDGESKRIIAVGDGRERFGHVFMFDTGSSTGEISGHSKAMNAVSIRQQRPFRAASGADDGLVVFYTGAPYKYEKTIRTHTKFVQDVRFAPSGSHFASVGSDAAIFLYDGATGDVKGQIGEGAHKGSIMGCTWSPDSKTLATSSADCTVKLWDIETQKETSTWTLGSGVAHQQVGNVWAGEGEIVSLSISGDLNIFDKRVGDKPARVISGPQKSITALSRSASSSTFLAGTADGRVLSYDTSSREATHLAGEGHTNYVSGMVQVDGEATVFSVGYDDRVREVNAGSFSATSTKTLAQPRTLAALPDGTLFVAEASGVEVVKAGRLVLSLPTNYTPSSIASSASAGAGEGAATPGGGVVAIGGEDQKVHLYDWAGNTLRATGVLEGNKGIVSALAFSPDGSLLAAGDSTGKIVLFSVPERKTITTRWSFHTARVNSVVFSPDGTHAASGSLDTNAYIWSVARPMKNIAIRGAGPGGVNAVLWVGAEGEGGDGKKGRLVSAGSDGAVRGWEVTFHPPA